MARPISAIIPSRGDSPFLRAAIASAAAAGAAEIVVALPEPIEPAPEPGVPFRQVSVSIRRCSVGRNAAIAAARHDRFALLDDDDLWCPDHVRVLDATFERHADAPFVATRARYFDDSTPDGTAEPPGEGRHAVYPPPGFGPRFGLAELLIANRVVAPAVAVDRARLPRGTPLFDESRHVIEDYDLWCRLAELGDGAVAERATVWVRRRPRSDSADARGMAWHSLDVLSRYEMRRAELGVPRDAWRERVGKLWHELAWAELAHGRGAAAREALARARASNAARGRHLSYWMASWIPSGIRRPWIASRHAAG